MMKKIALATLAAATLAGAAGAAAAQQPYGYGYENHNGYAYGHRWEDMGNINRRQAEIDRRIEWGIRNGSLTGREAWELRAESRDLARLEARYRYNGMSGWERADLDRRLDRLENRVYRQAHDDDRRWDRDDYHRRW
jgi:opacity protein-like surface antigen